MTESMLVSEIDGNLAYSDLKISILLISFHNSFSS